MCCELRPQNERHHAMLSGEATEALAAAKPDGAEVAQRAMKDEAFRNRMRLKIEDQESLASRMAQRRLDSARKRELAMESNRTAREAEGAPTPPGEVSEVSELRTEQPVSRNVRVPVAVMRDDEEAMAQYETDMRAWREAKALALIEQAREEEKKREARQLEEEQREQVRLAAQTARKQALEELREQQRAAAEAERLAKEKEEDEARNANFQQAQEAAEAKREERLQFTRSIVAERDELEAQFRAKARAEAEAAWEAARAAKTTRETIDRHAEARSEAERLERYAAQKAAWVASV